MTQTGLTLGKYAPFHKGHQHVVETAREEMDDVVVVVYTAPGLDVPPVNVRADWIRNLYPDVDVIEGWTLPTGTSSTRAGEIEHEKAIINRLNGREIDAFYSSEPYGEHMSKALDATDRRVDMDRTTVPVSGTKIRNAPYENREYVSDHVYKDLITNVVFLGGPSTGKTTLTEWLADQYNTERMPEYGREYWDTHQVDRRLTKDQLVEIAEGHIEREEETLKQANKYLFTDTNAITTYCFSQYYHGEAHPRLEELAQQAASRYDFVFVCDTDIPYDDTWDRSGEGNRERLQKQTIAYLDQHNIPYRVLSGNVEQRGGYVMTILNNHTQNSAEI